MSKRRCFLFEKGSNLEYSLGKPNSSVIPYKLNGSLFTIIQKWKRREVNSISLAGLRAPCWSCRELIIQNTLISPSNIPTLSILLKSAKNRSPSTPSSSKWLTPRSIYLIIYSALPKKSFNLYPINKLHRPRTAQLDRKFSDPTCELSAYTCLADWRMQSICHGVCITTLLASYLILKITCFTVAIWIKICLSKSEIWTGWISFTCNRKKRGARIRWGQCLTLWYGSW